MTRKGRDEGTIGTLCGEEELFVSQPNSLTARLKRPKEGAREERKGLKVFSGRERF